MRSLMVLAALLGMVVSLQAKEADLSRAVRSSDAVDKQLVSDQSDQPPGKNKVRWPQGP